MRDEMTADQSKLVIDLAALVGAGVAFVTGLLQYRRAQQLKRAEFLA